MYELIGPFATEKFCNLFSNIAPKEPKISSTTKVVFYWDSPFSGWLRFSCSIGFVDQFSICVIMSRDCNSHMDSVPWNYRVSTENG